MTSRFERNTRDEGQQDARSTHPVPSAGLHAAFQQNSPTPLLTASASAPQPDQTPLYAKHGLTKLDTVSTPQPQSSPYTTHSRNRKNILRERYVIRNSSSVCSEPPALQRGDLIVDSCCTLPDGSLRQDSCTDTASDRVRQCLNSPGLSSIAYSGRCLAATTAGSSWTSSHLSDSNAWAHIAPKARLLSRYAPESWDTEQLAASAPSRRQSGRSSCPSISPRNSLKTIPVLPEPQPAAHPTASRNELLYQHSSAPHLLPKPHAGNPCPPSRQVRRSSSLVLPAPTSNQPLDLLKCSSNPRTHHSLFYRWTKNNHTSTPQPLTPAAASAPLATITYTPTGQEDADEGSTGLTISIGLGEERPSVSALTTSGTFSAENWVELTAECATPISDDVAACPTTTTQVCLASDAGFLLQIPAATHRSYNKPSDITRTLYLQQLNMQQQGQQHDRMLDPGMAHPAPSGCDEPEVSVVAPTFCFSPSQPCSSSKCCQGIVSLEATAAFGSLSRVEHSPYLYRNQEDSPHDDGVRGRDAHAGAEGWLSTELGTGQLAPAVATSAAAATTASAHTQPVVGHAKGQHSELSSTAPASPTALSSQPGQCDFNPDTDEVPISPFSGSGFDLDLGVISGSLTRRGRITLAGGRKSPFSKEHLSIQVPSPASSLRTAPLMMTHSSLTQHSSSRSDDLGERADTVEPSALTRGLLQLPLSHSHDGVPTGGRLSNASVLGSRSERETYETSRSSSISQALASIFSIGSRDRASGDSAQADAAHAYIAAASFGAAPPQVVLEVASEHAHCGQMPRSAHLEAAMSLQVDAQPAQRRLTIWGSLTGVGWFGRSAAGGSSVSAPSSALNPATSDMFAAAEIGNEQKGTVGALSFPLFPLIPREGVCAEVDSNPRSSYPPPPSPQLTSSRNVLDCDTGCADTHQSKPQTSSKPFPRLLDNHTLPPSASSSCGICNTITTIVLEGLPKTHVGHLCPQEKAPTDSASTQEERRRRWIQGPEVSSLLQPPPVTVPAAAASAAVDASSLLAALSSFMGSGTMSDMWSESEDEQDGEGLEGFDGLEAARQSFENPAGAFMIDQAKPARLSSSLGRPQFSGSRSARVLSLPSSSFPRSAPIVPFPHHRLRSSMPNRAPPRLQQVMESEEVESVSSASTSARVSSVRLRPWDCQSQ